MALGTYRAADISRQLTYIGPHGNVSRKSALVTVPSTAKQNETVDFMELPKGVQIVDAYLNVCGALGTSVTLALGLAQKPGGSNALVDADAIIAATSAASAVFLRRNKTGILPSLLLLDDTYLIQATIGGADVGDNAVPIECTVFYENIGTP